MSVCPKCGEDELIMSFKSYNAYNGNISYWGVKCESCGFTVRSEKSIDDARFLWDHAGNTNALKPCPFCGGNVELRDKIDRSAETTFIHCTECHMWFERFDWRGADHKSIIQEWNKRASE